MSEKRQHTASSMREKMLNRYGNDFQHKHDKNHQSYRQHFRTHPVQISDQENQEEKINSATGLVRAANLRKIRKRLDKGHFH